MQKNNELTNRFCDSATQKQPYILNQGREITKWMLLYFSDAFITTLLLHSSYIYISLQMQNIFIQIFYWIMIS